ncbi:MAG: DNA repair protein RecO [Bacteroidota bacterium]
MLQKTKGIVLRSIKYGDTSLITTIFTDLYGIQAYMVQGVRSAKSRNNKAGLLQPATLLDLIVYHKPQQSLQRVREYQASYLYTSIQEEVIKNSIALFSVDLLSRLLPESAPMPELFEFVNEYFTALDRMLLEEVANFPIFFIVHCSKVLGYNINGEYSIDTPYLNLKEGAFTSNPPLISPVIHDEDAKSLNELLHVQEFARLKDIEMNAAMRYRLLDWYIEYLHQHTQHLGVIKSLAVLQAILH